MVLGKDVVGNLKLTQRVKRAKLVGICALLGYNAAFSGDSLPTFRYNPVIPSSRVRHDVSGKFYVQRSGNIGKELSLYAALHPRRAQI
jgi:hypothetical protein